MAIQVINDPYRDLFSSIGTSFGQGVQSGIGNALDLLSQSKAYELKSKYAQKMKDAERAENESFLESIGLSKDLAKAHPTVQREYIKQKLQEPVNKDFANALNAARGLGTQTQQPTAGLAALSNPQLGAEQQINSGLGILATPNQNTNIPEFTIPDTLNPRQQLDLLNVNQQEKKNRLSEARLKLDEAKIKFTAAENEKKRQLQEKLATIKSQDAKEKLQKQLEKEDTRIQQKEKMFEKTHEAKMLKSKIDREDKLQAKADKETLPTYNEINNEAKTAQENIDRLDKLVDLIKGGNLNGPAFSSVVSAIANLPFVGVDLSGLLTTDSQEFNKISADFIKGAKNIFGSRITDADLKAFLKTIPTLSQSDNGKLRVINNLKALGEASLVRQKVMNDIIAKNGGLRPANLKTEVEKASKPLLDELSKQFKFGGKKRITNESLGTAEQISDVLQGKRAPITNENFREPSGLSNVLSVLTGGLF